MLPSPTRRPAYHTHAQAVSAEEVLEYMEGKIARWWMPDDVVFVAEIPHTATGKISKLQLRRRFAEHKPRRARL